METIVLKIAWRGHAAGETITVDTDTAEWLADSGAVAPDVEEEKPIPAPPVEQEPTEQEPVEPAKTTRPKKAAPVAVWRTYLQQLGVDPKGLTKPEMWAVARSFDDDQAD